MCGIVQVVVGGVRKLFTGDVNSEAGLPQAGKGKIRQLKRYIYYLGLIVLCPSGRAGTLKKHANVL